MSRIPSECPKALDPDERLDMDVEAGGSTERLRFATDGSQPRFDEVPLRLGVAFHGASI
ncbi:MAG: hypothetical protein DHS20C11_36120 [Lysobacteraceae bacterium]|nr:MAG: hypothetical protein DHS20C11_36120 [Xanthomonadaceae bacterium]